MPSPKRKKKSAVSKPTSNPQAKVPQSLSSKLTGESIGNTEGLSGQEIIHPEVLPVLVSDEVNRQLPQHLATIQFKSQETFHMSPFPPAEELQAIESLAPGVTNRLMVQSEREQANAHTLQRRGQFMTFAYQLVALVAAVTFLGVVLFLAYQLLIQDKPTKAFFTLIGACVPIVLAFFGVQHSKKKKAEAETKSKK